MSSLSVTFITDYVHRFYELKFYTLLYCFVVDVYRIMNGDMLDVGILKCVQKLSFVVFNQWVVTDTIVPKERPNFRYY